MTPSTSVPPVSTPSGASAGWVLTTDDPETGYHPTFTGNGYLAARVPAAGNGFAEAPVRTQFQVAGFYADHEGEWSRKAGLPAWTTLDVGDGSGTFNGAFSAERGGEYLVGGDWSALSSPVATTVRGITRYRQALDLRTGVVTTEARWTSPAGRVADVRYKVLTDRSRPHVAAVTVTVTPLWSGRLEITDTVDLSAASWTGRSRTTCRQGRIDTSVTALGSGLVAAVATTLSVPAPASYRLLGDDGELVTLDVVAGTAYAFTKYVGIATGHDTKDPRAFARSAAVKASDAGYRRLAEDNRRAWRREWAGDIVVHGDDRLQRQVRASKYYLLTSAREGSPWAPSPAGLSSDGYNGHVFWDTETWIWPSLLAQHPDIAASVLDYRVRRLDDAMNYAAGHGQCGARFPWESGLHGREDTPVWAPFGRYEQHITADVALAFWQYWLATGDRRWLAEKGWPVLRSVAEFWCSRATEDAEGSIHITGVIPPDEYTETPVDDSVYTNVAARATLRFAAAAAAELGHPSDPAWIRTADGLIELFDEELGRHPQFAGYDGRQIKQADVVMLSYPWENEQSTEVTRADLEYYVPRTHEYGPSMTDSVHAIVYASLGDAKTAFTHTRRSIEPFLRDPFEQFAEARRGGAFTFLTGHGGFLQEFLYGYSGLRWRADQVLVAPVLPEQLDGLTLCALRWRGRVFDIDVRHTGTTVWLRSGEPLPVEVSGTRHVVPEGRRISVPTGGPSVEASPTAD
ncbi:glycosyl hydrolase family 65 protein [Streptomyces sp. CMB-StM0423]|uniref:glycosyl hydrolase family 65 protein n=1 Tax=Streptomyces sp. CMB-StM0423 TaxID=2059884 RepID=UPI000C708660|nr:glycosyl hydrolase family 65 protein [Streptomyces sp. CMB-StM0423]AUH39647.1 haloacid dehalogenase [Streptomyces sp. CMB-StM0423]